MSDNVRARYNLPGLFEYIELYRKFLYIYKNHREYFYDWCEIGSIYGAPSDCIWGGGRVVSESCNADEVLDLVNEYDFSACLTLSNSLITDADLQDRKCNLLCSMFNNPRNGVIVYSDLLLNYIRSNYPNFYFVSSTTKVLTDFLDLKKEVNRKEFSYVVPDFRLNKNFTELNRFSDNEKSKIDFLCNECCDIGCTGRKQCYESVSMKNLGISGNDYICSSAFKDMGYSFSRAMKNPSFISVEDIRGIYIPLGFKNFKIEGRGLGSAMVLELLLYYLIKPEYYINVREDIYLDCMLDLF